MAKRQTKQDKINAARIQRAVTGMQIPMLTIPRLYAHAEKMIAEGASDEQLHNGVRAFCGSQS